MSTSGTMEGSFHGGDIHDNSRSEVLALFFFFFFVLSSFSNQDLTSTSAGGIANVDSNRLNAWESFRQP